MPIKEETKKVVSFGERGDLFDLLEPGDFKKKIHLTIKQIRVFVVGHF